MIRLCQPKDIPFIYNIINESAQAYAEHIPTDCYHQPYMSLDELRTEMQRVSLYGWDENGQLTGVMGLEPIKGVTLIRHAYVLTKHQGKGIGRKLLNHLEAQTYRLLVGTWAEATWAVDFYKRNGFQTAEDKDLLLKTYWDISPRQIETSVVLEKIFPHINLKS
jgi:GNAT superfamily N-acetyltransferase